MNNNLNTLSNNFQNEKMNNEELNNNQNPNNELNSQLDNDSNFPTDYGEIESFEDLEIDNKILLGIISYGFERPSPIQRKAILPLL